MQTISFQGIFKYTSYLRFLRDVDVRSTPRELFVDFDGVRFFHPDGMAPLVATIRHLQDDCGWSISAAYPKDPFLQDYFDKRDGVREYGTSYRSILRSVLPMFRFPHTARQQSWTH